MITRIFRSLYSSQVSHVSSSDLQMSSRNRTGNRISRLGRDNPAGRRAGLIGAWVGGVGLLG